jgi:membrane-bound lytic murein transglycosylase B
MHHFFKHIIIVSLLFSSISASYADYTQRNDVKKFIKQFSKKNNFSQVKLTRVFAKIKKQERVLELISTSWEGKPWYDYKKIFATTSRITLGVQFWNKHKKTLLRAEKKYGVPTEIITSIIGIETYYGKNTGSFLVLDSLATLAFDYPKRSKFFTQELEHYLILSEQQKWKHKNMKGSYAGAMGVGQFISSSYRRYAVDFNNDGKINLFDPEDTIGSVANYFKQHKWHTGEKIIEPLYIKHIDEQYYSKITKKPKLTADDLKDVGVLLLNRKYQGKYNIIALDKNKEEMEYWLGYHNFFVITRYNHSNLYAMSAYLLSKEIKSRIGK